MKWFLVALIVAATSAGELLQAHKMKSHGEIHDFRPGALGRVFGRVFRDPRVFLSLLCMAVSFFAFLALLRVADLSFAVPATASTYVVETVLAALVLKEKIGRRRWAGAALVACGVFLVAL